LRLFLVVGWLAVALFTAFAFTRQPLGEAEVFITDIVEMGWRGAFNVDFTFHALLLALWVMWRHRFSALGVVCGLLCLCGGVLFSFAYLLVVSVQVHGDIKALLLGQQAVTAR